MESSTPDNHEPATGGANLNARFSAESLRHAVRRGSRRTLVAQGASHVVSLIVLASLYRLIGPRDFGLFAMVLPLLLLVRLFTSWGLNIATVQSRDVTPGLLSAFFWLHLALGLATTLVTVALAPLVVWFYDEPLLFGLTIGLAATSFVNAFNLQHVALLERNLRLGRSSLSRFGAQFVGGIVAIAVAWFGYGVWALVWQIYVEQVVQAAIAWRLEPWRPSRPMFGQPVLHALRYGGYFTASSFILYLLVNVDKILVGFALGPAALGLYSQAFNIMTKPVVILTTPLNSIMLPALARSSHERASYAAIVLAFERLLAVVSFPAGIGLMVVARETMLVLGGPAWNGAGTILAVLAPTILAQSFITMAGSIFVSAGRWRAMFIGSVVMAIVLVQGLIVGYYVGQHFGRPTLGVAAGYSLTTCLAMFVPYMVFCMRSVGVSPWTWARQLVLPAMAALAMGAIVLAARQALVASVNLPPIALLLIEMAIGGAAYCALAWRDVKWCLAQLGRM